MISVDPRKLSKLVEISFGKFDHMRRARAMMLGNMAGRMYRRMTPGDREDRKAAPLNLLYNAVTTLVPNLAYNHPKVMISTDLLPYREYADMLELATNHLLRKINIKSTLRKAIQDAIFMAGFIKTGIADSNQFVTFENEDVVIGQPFADRIDPDDMILDPLARDWDEQTFVGHRFRVASSDLVEMGLYTQDEVERMPGTYDGNNNTARDSAEGIMGDKSAQEVDQEIEHYVDLVELYLPQHKLIVTMPFERKSVTDEFLSVVEYDGPERGPYHMLGFVPMSNNIMPVAPAGLWYDLHILGNRIARKLSRQAERIKRVLAYTAEASEDAEAIAEADDGETVRVQDINQIKEVQYGGAGNDSYNWIEWIKKNFGEQAGNTDLLSGTSTNAPTATQAEMLQANTSVRLADMQNFVYDFTAEVTGDLVYYLHTDPLIKLPLVKEQTTQDPVTGFPVRQPMQLTFEGGQQQGDWLDYNIKIEPYSMARPDPNQKLQRIMQFVTNAIPAVAQAAQILGPGIMPGTLLRRIADIIGLEDADEWLSDAAFQQWLSMRMQMETGDPGKAEGFATLPPMAAAQPGGSPPQPMNPGQPNPQAYGRKQPPNPRNVQAQQAAGRIQQTRSNQLPTGQLAQNMSSAGMAGG